MIPNTVTVFKQFFHVNIYIAPKGLFINDPDITDTVHAECFQRSAVVSKEIPSLLVFFQVMGENFLFTDLTPFRVYRYSRKSPDVKIEQLLSTMEDMHSPSDDGVLPERKYADWKSDP